MPDFLEDQYLILTVFIKIHITRPARLLAFGINAKSKHLSFAMHC
jgi:hypothetical protein